MLSAMRASGDRPAPEDLRPTDPSHPRRSARGEDRYTFGDSDLAAARLRLLADVFAPASRHLLTRWVSRAPQHAVDLGSGPGYTTRLLHEETGAARTTGVERSPALLMRARRSAVDGITYIDADVTQHPLPIASADVVFSRFLLTHLADPRRVVSGWLDALHPGGRLLLQETAVITSDDPTFARYYTLLAQLQHHHGQDLTIGRRLRDAVDDTGVRVLHDARRDLHPSTTAMARLHAWNLRAWRHDPYAAAAFDPVELDGLHDRLDRMAERPVAGVEVSYTLGELVVQA
jgi:trans-aconitate 2-methyltransferase